MFFLSMHVAWFSSVLGYEYQNHSEVLPKFQSKVSMSAPVWSGLLIPCQLDPPDEGLVGSSAWRILAGSSALLRESWDSAQDSRFVKNDAAALCVVAGLTKKREAWPDRNK